MNKGFLRISSKRLIAYLVACMLFSFGAKFFIDSHLGVDPLDVQVIGLAKTFHTSLGIASGAVALTFLGFWALWNRKIPSPMPFVTAFFCGSLIDLWIYLKLETITGTIFNGHVALAAGLVICSFASSLIIRSGIGIRVMDLVALTFVEKLKIPFFLAKAILEFYLCFTGWMLGGPVGVGTVAFVIFLGPTIQIFLFINERLYSSLSKRFFNVGPTF